MLGVPYDIWMVVPRRILTELSQGNYVYIYTTGMLSFPFDIWMVVPRRLLTELIQEKLYVYATGKYV